MSDLIFLGRSTPAQDAALLVELEKAHAQLAASRQRPYGHSVRVVRAVRTVAHDRTYYEETIEIHRRGSRKTLERAARLVRGFIRLDGEIATYTAEQWVRVFGSGSERGTCHGLVSVH